MVIVAPAGKMTVLFGSWPRESITTWRNGQGWSSTQTYCGLPGTLTWIETPRLDLIWISARSTPLLSGPASLAHTCTRSL